MPPQCCRNPQMDQQALFAARDQVLAMHMAESLEAYLLQIVLATRTPEIYSDTLASWIEYGASPVPPSRSTAARAHAGWRPGLCHARRYPVARLRRAAAPGTAQLRGRSGRRNPDQFVEDT